MLGIDVKSLYYRSKVLKSGPNLPSVDHLLSYQTLVGRQMSLLDSSMSAYKALFPVWAAKFGHFDLILILGLNCSTKIGK